MNNIRRFAQKHSGIIILTAALILIFVLLALLRNIILPFLVGLVIAYLLFPAVSWLERHFPKPGKWQSGKRITAILIVFILVLVVTGTASFYFLSTVIENISTTVNNAPEYLSQAFNTIQTWLYDLAHWLPIGSEQEITNQINDIGQSLGTALQNWFLNSAKQIPNTFSYIMGFATLPLFLFYLLKDNELMFDKVYSGFSPNTTRHIRNILGIIDRVLGGYMKAQLAMGFAVGTLALIGLLILDVPFAFGLAVIAGITEMVPVIGPWIGGGIAALMTLAVEPDKVIWVIVIFLVVQLLENMLLVPRIHGHYLKIHPAIAVVLVIIGSSVAGFWGLIITLPLAATIVGLYQYVRSTVKEEEENQLVEGQEMERV